MTEHIKLIHIDETVSTNQWIRDYQGEKGCLMTVVSADYQTSGRGQGTNRWESERCKNLLVSFLIHPDNVPVARQFVLLEAAALAVTGTLSLYADGFRIKWPNDIYYKDRKISGTLSECNIGSNGITLCIIGIGININQQMFTSDAPNPISLAQILGAESDRKEILDQLIYSMEQYLRKVSEGQFDDIHTLYQQKLYRANGRHRYRDNNGEFRAEIENIKPNGHMILKREDGTLSEYAFKEVTFI